MNSVKGGGEGKAVENTPNTNGRWAISKKKILTVIIVMLIISTTLWALVVRESSKTTFSYKVSVYVEQDIGYTVIVPFPNISADVEHWQEYILNGISNPDSAELELVETEHGTGLKIVSDRSISLELNRKVSIPVDGVTMRANESPEYGEGILYWIYGRYSQNVSSDFYVTIDMRKHTDTSSLFGFKTGHGQFVSITSWNTISSINIGWGKYVGDGGYTVG